MPVGPRKSLHVQSFLQQRGPDINGTAQTKPALQRVSRELNESRPSPQQSLSTLQSALQVAPVGGENTGCPAASAGLRQRRVGHSRASRLANGSAVPASTPREHEMPTFGPSPRMQPAQNIGKTSEKVTTERTMLIMCIARPFSSVSLARLAHPGGASPNGTPHKRTHKRPMGRWKRAKTCFPACRRCARTAARLHDKATTRLCPRSLHRTRRKPCAEMPQRRYASNSSSTKAGKARRPSAVFPNGTS